MNKKILTAIYLLLHGQLDVGRKWDGITIGREYLIDG